MSQRRRTRRRCCSCSAVPCSCLQGYDRKTLGLMCCILSILERRSSALLLNNKNSDVAAAVKEEPRCFLLFLLLHLLPYFFICRSQIIAMTNKRLYSMFALKDTARWWAPARSSSQRRRGSRGSSHAPVPTAAPSPAAPPPSFAPGLTQTWLQSRFFRSCLLPASRRRRPLWREGGKNNQNKMSIFLIQVKIRFRPKAI